MKRQMVIFIVAAAMIAGTGGFLWFLQSHQKLSKPGVKVVAVPMYGIHGQLVGSNSVYLPEAVLNFTSTAKPVDDKILEWLPRDTTYGQRVYKGSDGLEVQMSVVLMGTDRTSIHRPQFCLPAQGWVIDQEEQRTVQMTEPYRYSLPVMNLKAHTEVTLPDGRRMKGNAIYVYWFVSDEELTAVHENYMWSILTHLLSKGELQRWAYVSCFTLCNPGEEERAFERVQNLVANAAPKFQLVAGPQEAPKRAALSQSKEAVE